MCSGYLQAEVVGAALSEAEAVACLQANEEAWQLLVVDLLLKQGTGLGVLAGIMAALTNAASPDNRAECVRPGVDTVFDKAAEVNEFLAYCAAEH
ncbi:ActR/RegA family two-component response regulator [Variovorax paradoxus]|uniref:ActR/RegA family two-component response regulator n=1 Tax=Variovorax paradoxus TaxID=34073 RepID=A0AAW8EEW3_VARPD|nr:histidine kinase [Variovorax paradoxus]MDP9971701.1 ActR/RegA family two-component response regulator [Variovorax paradoxus]